MSLESKEWGKRAEQLAADLLICKGYFIRERNFRMGHLEIDIIAQKGTTVCFIEVKARNGKNEDPLDAVDKNKVRRIVKVADSYMRSLDYDMDCRFDIITITGTEDDYNIEHIEDAFFPPLGNGFSY